MNRMRLRTGFAILVAAGLAAVTFWRSPVSLQPSREFVVEELALPEVAEDAPLRATGLWEINGTGAGFGGFSALIAMPGGQLRSFSDRGWRFTFTMDERGPGAMQTAQVIPEEGYRLTLFDIESATESPEGESYWLGYEATHAIHRFDGEDAPGSVRLLVDEVNLPENTGIEALVRLEDGRFIAFPETGVSGLLFAGDPAEGAPLQEFPVTWPLSRYSPTDAAQLPDGRVLVLMRRFSLSPWPEFRSALVVGNPPQPDGVWEPELLAELDQIIPSENYEGLAIRSRPDGSSTIWLISDDNFSAFQRTLLARLELSAAR